MLSSRGLQVSDNKPLDAQLFGNGECVSISSTAAICSPANVNRIDVVLNSGDDRYLSSNTVNTVVSGGTGDDTYLGGLAGGSSKVDFAGGDGFDTASYEFADAGVQMVKDISFNDGRSGRDNDRIGGDVERLIGSRFGDTVLGGSSPVEHLDGRAGDDTLTGNGGNHVFVAGAAADGADRMFGGDGIDRIDYAGRTRPVTANLSDGGADDGEAGERDELRQIESARGGAAGDTLRAHPDGTAAVTLIGNGGGDTITGARGGDLLNGSAGRDTITGDAGNDVIQARDGEQDTVGCGTETDTALVDNGLDLFGGCERFDSVGVLGLTPKAAQVRARRAAVLKLSWRHPASWRQLRNVTLKLGDDGVAVGQVGVRVRDGKLSARGGVRLVAGDSRVATKGKTARAKLVIKLDRSLAGRRLDLDVEATDKLGRRQLETGVGTLRIG